MALGAGMTMKMVIEAQDKASKSIVQLQKEVERLQGVANKASGEIERSFGSSIPNSVKTLGKYLGVGYLVSKLGQVGVGATNLAANLEQAEMAFTTMLGSVESANKLLAGLSDFAKKTPFELVGIRQTAKQLIAMGVAADEVLPTLKSLGDVSSALSVPLEQVAYAYGQVRAANQLYGTELRQFMNAGVPILAELARMYGVTEAAAKKMVEEGKVGFNDVKQAFVNMSSEGGFAFDFMDKQSSTLNGKISNLRDTVAQLGEKFGKPLLAPAKETFDKISTELEKIGDAQIKFGSTVVISLVKSFESIVGVVTKAVGLLEQSLSGYTQLVQLTMNQVQGSNQETISALSGSWKDLFVYLSLGIQGIAGAFNILMQIAVDSFGFIADVGAKGAKVVASAFRDMGNLIAGIFTSIDSQVAHGVAKAINVAVRLINKFINAANGILPNSLSIGNLSEVAVPAAQSIASAFDKAFESTSAGWKELTSAASNSFAGTRKAMDSLVNDLEDTWFGFAESNMPNYLKEVEQGFKGVANGASGAGSSIEDLTKAAGKGAEKAKDELKELEKLYEEIAKNTNKRADEHISKTKDIVKSIEGHISKIEELKGEYTALAEEARKAIDAINKEISGVGDSAEKDIATRFVEIENELAKMSQERKKMLEEGASTEEWDTFYAKLEQLNNERQIAIENTSKEAREAAQAWDSMNEVERIIQTTQKTIEALEIKKNAMIEEYQAKLDNLQQQAIAEQQALEEQQQKHSNQVNIIREIWRNHFGQLEADARGSALNLIRQYDIIAERINALSALQADTGISVRSYASQSTASKAVEVSVTFNVSPNAVSSITPQDIARMKEIVNEAIAEGRDQAALGVK